MNGQHYSSVGSVASNDVTDAPQTWVNPDTDVTVGAETGREPLAKTASYYKRNWCEGKPYSVMPTWADLSHVPPSRRELIARPDLALAAMRRILTKVESELVEEAENKERLRMKREDRLARIRQRHVERHEAQRKIGIEPINHKHAKILEKRKQALLTSSSSQSLPGLVSSGSATGINGHRPAPLTMLPGSSAASLGGPASPGARSISSAGKSRHARDQSSPMVGKRAGQVVGLEGLLIPRFQMRSPSPSDANRESRPRSASKTPPPRSPEPPPTLVQHWQPQYEASSPADHLPHPHPHAIAEEEEGGGAYGPAGGGQTAHMPPIAPTGPAAMRPSASAASMHRTPYERAMALNAAMSRSPSAMSVAPPTGSVASAAASLSGAGRAAAPLLGWAETHGQCLGRPPRRSPFHFEGGLAKHHQPPQPRAAYKSAARGIVTSEPAIDLNLRVGSVGDGSTAYELTPAVSGLAPVRWSPAREDPHRGRQSPVIRSPSRESMRPASPDWGQWTGKLNEMGSVPPSPGMETAPGLPPSPDSLARAARALAGAS